MAVSRGSPAAGTFDWLLGLMSAAPLALILVLTFTDVLMRYLFAKPIQGSSEIIQFAMAMTIFAALPVVTRRRGHITVSMTDGLFKGSMRLVKVLTCDGISLVALGLIAWRLGVQASEYVESQAASVVLGMGMAPLTYAMCAFAILTCIVVLLQIAATLRRTPTPEASA